MDCMEYLKEIPDNWFDLAVVDPPYGISINMNMGKKKGEIGRYQKKDWDSKTPDNNYFNDLIRCSKNQIIWGGNYFTDKLSPSIGWICWDKEVPIGVSFSDFELAWTSFNIAAKKANIPYCGFIGLNGQKRIHPTEKPIKLYDWIFQKYLPEGGKVLDTHLGSGSSRISADKAGNIDFYGTEIDSDYFNDHIKRWNIYKSQPTLFQQTA